ncbi:MAG: hypothetical protein ACI8X3_002666 [Saprospiraceae bacterium]|jgi:hypothetical protein
MRHPPLLNQKSMSFCRYILNNTALLSLSFTRNRKKSLQNWYGTPIDQESVLFELKIINH